MKSPKMLYILISVFCIFAIIAGIYAQFIEKRPENSSKGSDNIIVQKDAQTIKTEFNNIFTNTLNLNGYDTTGIQKIDDTKQIVYTAFDIVKSENAYEVDIKVPVVNIKDEIATSFNNITQAIFVNKASEVLAKTDDASKTIYSIEYVGYINGDVLSLIIRSTLKDGQSAQRVMIQTYNYNLDTRSKIELTDLITLKGLNKDEVNNRIKKVVKEADEESKAVQSMGYNEIFTRDLSNQMYTVDNSSTYFLGPDNKLYIIYAYGNQNFTSEMDIVLFE